MLHGDEGTYSLFVKEVIVRHQDIARLEDFKFHFNPHGLSDINRFGYLAVFRAHSHGLQTRNLVTRRVFMPLPGRHRACACP
jgi:IS4 transposase